VEDLDIVESINIETVLDN